VPERKEKNFFQKLGKAFCRWEEQADGSSDDIQGGGQVECGWWLLSLDNIVRGRTINRVVKGTRNAITGKMKPEYPESITKKKGAIMGT